MFAATLILAFAVAHVTAEIPSYIHVCGRRDPNIDECILKNVENLKSKICEGIPELSIHSSEPMYIEKINVINTDNAKISLKDMYITGLCDYTVNSFHLNLEKLHFDVDMTFRRINMNMSYDFNVNILVPVALKGPLHLSSDNVLARGNIDLKVTTKDGKKYVYMSNMDLDLDIKGYEVDLSLYNDAELNQLRQIGQNFLGQSQQEIIKVMKPMLEKIVTERILNVSNKIVKHFTFDELFPDRE